MKMFMEELVYIKPEKQIYDFAIKEDNIDWRGFLFELIEKKNMDPFDINLTNFTVEYLNEIRNSKNVNFNLVGKFLTIAVFLLKVKSEKLLKVEISNYSSKVDEIENLRNELEEELEDGFFSDEDSRIDMNLIREKYKLDFKTPLERKKKVSIYDLVETLEKTLKQSSERKKNFFQKKEKIEYDGPEFKKKEKDLKTIIEEIYSHILDVLENDSKNHLYFKDLTKNSNTKIEILEKFIPLLHLHNGEKIYLKQEKNFSDIKIHLN